MALQSVIQEKIDFRQATQKKVLKSFDLISIARIQDYENAKTQRSFCFLGVVLELSKVLVNVKY